MDPFRDELAAANEKIASLEREIQLLNAAKVRVPWGRPGFAGWLTIAFSSFLAVILSSPILLHYAGAKVPVADPTFRGVAVAPKDDIPPVVDPGNVAAKTPAPVDSANPYTGDKRCKCSPGDPLCSCH